MRHERRKWVCVAVRLFAFPAVLSGCGSSEGDGPGFATGPLMRPGDDCLRCHSAGSKYPEAKHWTLAGTIFPRADASSTEGVAGASLIVSTPDGKPVLTLVSNSVGNFYTDVALPSGFRVAVEFGGERIDMPCAPPAGNCAACHSLPPIGGPTGRIYVPGGGPSISPDFDCSSWSRP